jgi:DNA polymerase V
MLDQLWEIGGNEWGFLHRSGRRGTAQEIQSSRSFGTHVQDLEQLEEAVATYIATAAVNLRSQSSLAARVHIYIRTNPFKPDRPQYQLALTVPLTVATDDTLRLTQAALWGLRQIYRPGYGCQKARITQMDLVDAGTTQVDLFCQVKDNTRVMQAMDRINRLWGKGTLRSGAEAKGSTSGGRCDGSGCRRLLRRGGISCRLGWRVNKQA